jgi:hypothetical protein
MDEKNKPGPKLKEVPKAVAEVRELYALQIRRRELLDALGIDDAQFFHNRTSSTPEEVERCKAFLAAGGYTALDMARAGRQIFDRAARKVKIDETLEEK